MAMAGTGISARGTVTIPNGMFDSEKREVSDNDNQDFGAIWSPKALEADKNTQ